MKFKKNYYYINSNNNQIIENFDLLSGNRGPKGDRGDEGEIGDRGINGIKGDPGPIGDRGFEGPIGLPGPMGKQGPKGKKGLPGKNGRRGPRGDRGDKGNPNTTIFRDTLRPRGNIAGWRRYQNTNYGGVPGEGPRGEKGHPGFQGPPGKRGPRGKPGSKGPKGDKGYKAEIGFNYNKCETHGWHGFGKNFKFVCSPGKVVTEFIVDSKHYDHDLKIKCCPFKIYDKQEYEPLLNLIGKPVTTMKLKLFTSMSKKETFEKRFIDYIDDPIIGIEIKGTNPSGYIPIKTFKDYIYKMTGKDQIFQYVHKSIDHIFTKLVKDKKNMFWKDFENVLMNFNIPVFKFRNGKRILANPYNTKKNYSSRYYEFNPNKKSPWMQYENMDLRYCKPNSGGWKKGDYKTFNIPPDVNLEDGCKFECDQQGSKCRAITIGNGKGYNCVTYKTCNMSKPGTSNKYTKNGELAYYKKIFFEFDFYGNKKKNRKRKDMENKLKMQLKRYDDYAKKNKRISKMIDAKIKDDKDSVKKNLDDMEKIKKDLKKKKEDSLENDLMKDKQELQKKKK